MAEQATTNGLTTRVKSWVARPFTEEMDLGRWALMAVFLTTVVVLWLQILHVMRQELE